MLVIDIFGFFKERENGLVSVFRLFCPTNRELCAAKKIFAEQRRNKAFREAIKRVGENDRKPCGNQSCHSSVSIRSSSSAFKRRWKWPFSAIEMPPVSSETQIARQSLFCEMPKAERCRRPSALGMSVS